MAAFRAGTWTFVLGFGFAVAMLLGAGIAIAAPSDSGRPRWDESAPQRITGSVESIGEDAFVLDGLVAYDPPQGAIGHLVIHWPEQSDGRQLVEPPEALRVGDTVDVVVVREDRRWVATEMEPLDPD